MLQTKKRLSVVLISFVSLICLAAFNTSYCYSPQTNEFGAPYDFIAPITWDQAPLVLIHNPLNQTVLNRNQLNFTIHKPLSWYNNESKFWINGSIEQTLISVSYQIDNDTIQYIQTNTNLNSTLEYLIDLPYLSNGAHLLTVSAGGTGVYRNTHNVWQAFPINATSIVIFVVDSTQPSAVTNNNPLLPTDGTSVILTLAVIGSALVTVILLLIILFRKYRIEGCR